MTEKEQKLFYVGAAIFLDLDSTEVDDALSAKNLTVESNSVSECTECIRRCFPERFSFSRMVKPC